MTATETEAALLAAIRENPGEDTPRLVLADWLAGAGRELDAIMQRIIAQPGEGRWRLDYAAELERTAGAVACEACKGCGKIGIGNNGNPYMSTCDECHGTGRVSDGRAELAAFVRLQVELAAEHSDCGAKGYDPCGERCEELRRRERELWPAVRGVFGVHEFPEVIFVPDRFLELRDLGPQIHVSRGLPSVVRCTLAEWMGGDCAACVGTGWTQASEPTSVMMPRCSQCQGKGEIPGIGPRLAQRWPVVAVEVTDKRPHFAGDLWWFHSRSDAYLHWPDDCRLPRELLAATGGHFTEPAARAAASDALIAWARGQEMEEKR